jgi:Fur family transcriptional regulator, ferric uptake regulator
MHNSKNTTAESLLKEHHLKTTPQRLSVLTIFLEKNKVLSLADLNKHLGNSFDRITLYRTLNAFEEKGIIHKIADQGGNLNYALCRHESVAHMHNENHVHFKCTNCDLTLCLEDVEIPDIKLPKKFKPLKYNFLIEGICEDCNK